MQVYVLTYGFNNGNETKLFKSKESALAYTNRIVEEYANDDIILDPIGNMAFRNEFHNVSISIELSIIWE